MAKVATHAVQAGPLVDSKGCIVQAKVSETSHEPQELGPKTLNTLSPTAGHF